MAGQRHADGHSHDQETTGKAMKRRGILAAAGAVVAGIVAKQASQPVAATTGTGPDGNLVLGSNDINNTTNYANLRTQIVSGIGNPPGTGFHGAVLFDCSASPFQSSGDTNVIGISGTSRGTAAGIYGSDSVGSKPSGYPVNMNAGVYGYTSAQGHSGVRGDGGTSGIGVSGVSANSNAILGTTLGSPFNGNAAVLGLGNAIGVEGDVTAGSSMANSIAVKGVNQSSGAGGAGVYGASTGGYGVVGISSRVGFAGISGITSTANVSAFAGGSSTPSALAAYFNGGVYIDCTTAAGGQFVVNPMTAKSGLLAHPDGSHRLMYSLEAPESWAEDVGTGKLVNGKAEVKLDPDFAAVIHTDEYHVFLTGHDELSEGLVVTARGASSFTVKERKGGATSGTFSWRLMAKPKVDNHVATRFAKYDLPAPLHLPTADELPKLVNASVPTVKTP